MTKGATEEAAAVPAELFASLAVLFERLRDDPHPLLEQWLPAAASLSGSAISADWLASAERIAVTIRVALGKLLERQDHLTLLTGKMAEAAMTIDAARRHFLADPAALQRLVGEVADLWREVFAHCGLSLAADGRGGNRPPLPLTDPRFDDPLWCDALPFAILHQTWLLLEAEAASAAADDPLTERLRSLIAAVDPRGFPLTDPGSLAKFLETRGGSLADWLSQRLQHLTT